MRNNMKQFFITLLLIPLLAKASSFHSKEQMERISHSVVKIYTTSVAPDYMRPWRKGIERSSSGSGVVIDGERILTAAHVVENGTFIQVKKSDDAKKYIAKVKWISNEADLALLEVKEKRFFKGIEPGSFGGLPYRQDGVVVYGYPMGGDEISTTKGIVSRIEHTFYTQGYMDHLTLQIDAPINPGNSGGPAFDKEGNIVGIAIQGLTRSDGIGYLVPVEVIQHFFDDIADGRYDGYPGTGVGFQYLENESIRAFYGLKERTGVLASSLLKNASAEGIVHKGDVILAMDGVKIAGDRTIKLRQSGRVDANYLVRKHQVGEKLKLTLLRDGKETDVEVPLKSNMGIIPFEHGKAPRFYMYGGIVFVPLTINYLKIWGNEWYTKAPLELLHIFMNQTKVDRRLDEIVILSTVLPNEANANYSTANKIVTHLNGTRVTSLKHFARLIEESKGKYVDITIENEFHIILDKQKAKASDASTMRHYGLTIKQRLKEKEDENQTAVSANSGR